MINQLGWRSLQQRRADIRLLLFYKIVHGLIVLDFSQELIPVTTTLRHLHPDSYLLPSDFRNQTTYIQQRTLVQSFLPWWNSLPASVAAATTLDSFKSGVYPTKSAVSLPLNGTIIFTFSYLHSYTCTLHQLSCH